MSVQQPIGAHGVARHLGPESFVSFAHAELQAAPPWVAGVCFNPACGAAFTKRRDWQIYCSAPCERAGVAELRRWGHRMALPLLVWRMGKYEAKDMAVQDVTRAARRYVTQAQSAWLADRLAAAGKGAGL